MTKTIPGRVAMYAVKHMSLCLTVWIAIVIIQKTQTDRQTSSDLYNRYNHIGDPRRQL